MLSSPRMSPAEFETLVRKAFLSIPERFRRELDNVAVCVDDACFDDPELLGLYEGVARTERGIDTTGLLPDKITLYRKTILDEAEDTDQDVYRVIRETLVHEIGHHFGMDDDEIDRVFEEKWDQQNGA